MAATGSPRATLETLVETYGRGLPRVLELAGKLPDGSERLCPNNPEIVAQLHHAVREEMAVSLQDVLLRRTGIGQSRCQGLDCAEAIGRRMAELAGWSPRRLDAELEAYSRHVELSRRFRHRDGLASVAASRCSWPWRSGSAPPRRLSRPRVVAVRPLELARSPDGDPTDWLEFAPDGRMTDDLVGRHALQRPVFESPGERSSSTSRSATSPS